MYIFSLFMILASLILKKYDFSYRPFGLGGTSGYGPPDYDQRMTFSHRRLLSYLGAGRLTWFRDQVERSF